MLAKKLGFHLAGDEELPKTRAGPGITLSQSTLIPQQRDWQWDRSGGKETKSEALTTIQRNGNKDSVRAEGMRL